jgi:hypothetical protein
MILRGQSGQLLPSQGSASGLLQAAAGSGDSSRRSSRRRLPLPLPLPLPLLVLVVGWWGLSNSSSKVKQGQCGQQLVPNNSSSSSSRRWLRKRLPQEPSRGATRGSGSSGAVLQGL